MIIGKSKKELEKMRAAGRLVGQVREHLRGMVKPGITTLEIDRVAEQMIRDAGALPTFKGYNGFPYSICASVNEQIVHGFPSNYALKEGDIFSIDCGVTLEGFVGDTATTVPVGAVDEEKLKLIQVTEECLERAIQKCRARLVLPAASTAETVIRARGCARLRRSARTRRSCLDVSLSVADTPPPATDTLALTGLRRSLIPPATR